MKLYVDDIRQCPEGWELARTVTEAIRALATLPIEEVSLDHDIACECCRSQDGIVRQHFLSETFEPVAWYIALMEKKPVVQFHTANFHGQARMENILEDKC